MASSSGPLNEELQCSICLDVFTDPVTTPCGHNFCKTCLNKCWTITHTCFCPLCKETFSRRPAIKINTTLREVVQHFKEKLNQEESEQMIQNRMKKIQEIQHSVELRKVMDVTLDPDTAASYLILSDDGKQVSDGDIEQDVPENPKRFDDCCVLAKEGFRSGRFYYEVQVEGKSDWNLGVVRESINRKGEISPSPENGFWLLGEVTENLYLVSDNPFVTFFLETPEKVGVFVDYEEGLVSFYDVESSSHIYSFTGQTFTDKLYPYFGPGDNDAGKNSNPLIISPVSSN
uniref:Uncharacterized protein n=1 Tax=Sinocyclocheilus rhinocerous TaxID=307959 RepID=A0A673GSW9_9TELE